MSSRALTQLQQTLGPELDRACDWSIDRHWTIEKRQAMPYVATSLRAYDKD